MGVSSCNVSLNLFYQFQNYVVQFSLGLPVTKYALCIAASNIYSESMEKKSGVGEDGRRSSLGMKIDRRNDDSILPAIPLVQKNACIDHAAARVTETLINLTLETVVSRKDVASEDSLARVDIFCRNLAARDIHQMDRVGVVDGKLKVIKPRNELPPFR